MTDDIGGRLRRAREQRGLSLRDAAKRTKLAIFMLEAIERNDFERLPGGMFRKAYVKTLAAEVGLDPEELANEYGARFEPPPPPEEPAPAQSGLALPLDRYLRPSRSPVPSLVVLAALACGWLIFRSGPVSPEMPVAPPDVQLVMAGVPLGASPISMANDRFEAPLPVAIAVAPRAPLRIEMRITGPCWIAADADGDRVVYRLVAQGERVVLEAQHTISLRVGNAGAVAIWINGAPGRSLGRQGEVADLHVTTDNVDSLSEDTVVTASRGEPSRPSRPAAARRDPRAIRA
jgi:transcriptional regulator with XRE-family HTH domain